MKHPLGLSADLPATQPLVPAAHLSPAGQLPPPSLPSPVPLLRPLEEVTAMLAVAQQDLEAEGSQFLDAARPVEQIGYGTGFDSDSKRLLLATNAAVLARHTGWERVSSSVALANAEAVLGRTTSVFATSPACPPKQAAARAAVATLRTRNDEIAALAHLDNPDQRTAEIKRIADGYMGRIMGLGEGETFLMPGGWLGADDDHFMIYRFEKKGGKYNLHIFSAENEAQDLHGGQTVGPKRQRHLALVFDGIDPKALFFGAGRSSITLQELINLRLGGPGSSKWTYNTVLDRLYRLAARPVNPADLSRSSDLALRRATLLAGVTKANNRATKVLNSFLIFLMDEDGEDRTSKAQRLDIRLLGLVDFYRSHRAAFEGGLGIEENRESLAMLEAATRHFQSKLCEYARKRPPLFTDEAFQKAVAISSAILARLGAAKERHAEILAAKVRGDPQKYLLAPVQERAAVLAEGARRREELLVLARQAAAPTAVASARLSPALLEPELGLVRGHACESWAEMAPILTALRAKLEAGSATQNILQCEAVLQNLRRLKNLPIPPAGQAGGVDPARAQQCLDDLQVILQLYMTAVSKTGFFTSVAHPRVQNASAEVLALSYKLAVHMDNLLHGDRAQLASFGLTIGPFLESTNFGFVYSAEELEHRRELLSFFQGINSGKEAGRLLFDYLDWRQCSDQQIGSQRYPEAALYGGYPEVVASLNFVPSRGEEGNTLSGADYQRKRLIFAAKEDYPDSLRHIGFLKEIFLQTLPALSQVEGAGMILAAGFSIEPGRVIIPGSIFNGIPGGRRGILDDRGLSDNYFVSSLANNTSTREALRPFLPDSHAVVAAEENALLVGQPRGAPSVAVCDADLTVSDWFARLAQDISLLENPVYRAALQSSFFKLVRRPTGEMDVPLLKAARENPALLLRKINELTNTAIHAFSVTCAGNPKVAPLMFFLRLRARVLDVCGGTDSDTQQINALCLTELDAIASRLTERRAKIQADLAALGRDSWGPAAALEEQLRTIGQDMATIQVAKLDLLVNLPFTSLTTEQMADIFRQANYVHGIHPVFAAKDHFHLEVLRKIGSFRTDLLAWLRQNSERAAEFASLVVGSPRAGEGLIAWNGPDANGVISGGGYDLDLNSCRLYRDGIWLNTCSELGSHNADFTRLFGKKRFFDAVKLAADREEYEVSDAHLGRVRIKILGDARMSETPLEIRRYLGGKWCRYLGKDDAVLKGQLNLPDGLIYGYSHWLADDGSRLIISDLASGVPKYEMGSDGSIVTVPRPELLPTPGRPPVAVFAFDQESINPAIAGFDSAGFCQFLSPGVDEQRVFLSRLVFSRFRTQDGRTLEFHFVPPDPEKPGSGGWIYGMDEQFRLDERETILLKDRFPNALCLTSLDGKKKKLLIPKGSVGADAFSGRTLIGLATPEENAEPYLSYYEYERKGDQLDTKDKEAKIYLAHTLLAQRHYQEALEILQTISVGERATPAIVENLRNLLFSIDRLRDDSPNANAVRLYAAWLLTKLGYVFKEDETNHEQAYLNRAIYGRYLTSLQDVDKAILRGVEKIEQELVETTLDQHPPLVQRRLADLRAHKEREAEQLFEQRPLRVAHEYRRLVAGRFILGAGAALGFVDLPLLQKSMSERIQGELSLEKVDDFAVTFSPEFYRQFVAIKEAAARSGEERDLAVYELTMRFNAMLSQARERAGAEEVGIGGGQGLTEVEIKVLLSYVLFPAGLVEPLAPVPGAADLHFGRPVAPELVPATRAWLAQAKAWYEANKSKLPSMEGESPIFQEVLWPSEQPPLQTTDVNRLSRSLTMRYFKYMQGEIAKLQPAFFTPSEIRKLISHNIFFFPPTVTLPEGPGREIPLLAAATPLPAPDFDQGRLDLTTRGQDGILAALHAQFLIRADSLPAAGSSAVPDFTAQKRGQLPAVAASLSSLEDDCRQAERNAASCYVMKPDADWAMLKERIDSEVTASDANEKRLEGIVRRLVDLRPLEGPAMVTRQALALAGREKPVAMVEIMRAAADQDEERSLAALRRLNPSLSPAQIQTLRQAAVEYMVELTHHRHLANIQKNLLKRAEALAASRPDDVAEYSEEVGNLLAEERAYNPYTDKFTLLFEYMTEMRVRGKQAEIIRKLVAAVYGGAPGEQVRSLVFQLMMAGGKTSVIISCISKLAALKGRLVVVSSHHSQFVSTCSNMTAFQKERWGDDTYILDYAFEELGEQRQLDKLFSPQELGNLKRILEEIKKPSLLNPGQHIISVTEEELSAVDDLLRKFAKVGAGSHPNLTFRERQFLDGILRRLKAEGGGNLLMARIQVGELDRLTSILDQAKRRSAGVLGQILSKLREAKRVGAPVILKNTFLQSLQLKFIAANDPDPAKAEEFSPEEVVLLAKINQELSAPDTLGVFDECHLSFDIDNETNIPNGERQLLLPERADLVAEIFKNLARNPALRDVMGLIKENRQADIAPAEYEARILPLLARDLFPYAGLRTNRELDGLRCDPECFRRYLCGEIKYSSQLLADRALRTGRPVAEIAPELARERAEAPPFTEQEMNDAFFIIWLNKMRRSEDRLDQEAAQEIALAGRMLSSVLPLALSKGCNRGFGRDEDKGDGRVIPFLGVDQPSPTEFGYAYLKLALHFMAALHNPTPEPGKKKPAPPIPGGEVRFLASKWLDAARAYAQEAGGIEHTDEYEEFSALTGGVKLTEVLEDERALAAAVAFLADDANIEKRLAFESEVAAFHVTYYPGRVGSNHLDMTDQLGQAIACSGTPDNYPEYSKKFGFPAEESPEGEEPGILLEAGTEGALVSEIARRAGPGVPQNLREVPDESLGHLLSIAQTDPKVRGIIDADGFCKVPGGTAEVARRVLEARPDINVVLYVHKFTEEERLARNLKKRENFVLLRRGATDPIPLETSTRAEVLAKMGLSGADDEAKLRQLFTIYDEPRVTGTDTPQAKDSRNIVTIGHRTQRRTSLQAPLRLRQFLKRQDAIFVVTQKARSQMINGGATMLDILATFERNRVLRLAERTLRSYQKQLDSVVRTAVLKKMAEYGSVVDLENPEASLKKVRDFSKAMWSFLCQGFEDDPFAQYGRISGEESPQVALSRYQDSLLRRLDEKLAGPAFADVRAALTTTARDGTARLLALAGDDPNLPELVPTTVDENIGQQVEMQQAQEVEVEMNQNVEQQQEGEIIDELGGAGRAPRTEVVLAPADIPAGVAPVERRFDWRGSLVGLQPVSLGVGRDQNMLRMYPGDGARSLAAAQVLFPENIQTTENFRLTFEGQAEAAPFSRFSKTPAFVLATEDPAGRLNFVMLSHQEAGNLKRWMERNRPQNVWLLDVNGNQEVLNPGSDLARRPDLQGALEEGIWRINLYSGNIDYLEKQRDLSGRLIAQGVDPAAPDSAVEIRRRRELFANYLSLRLRGNDRGLSRLAGSDLFRLSLQARQIARGVVCRARREKAAAVYAAVGSYTPTRVGALRGADIEVLDKLRDSQLRWLTDAVLINALPVERLVHLGAEQAALLNPPRREELKGFVRTMATAELNAQPEWLADFVDTAVNPRSGRRQLEELTLRMVGGLTDPALVNMLMPGQLAGVAVGMRRHIEVRVDNVAELLKFTEGVSPEQMEAIISGEAFWAAAMAALQSGTPCPGWLVAKMDALPPEGNRRQDFARYVGGLSDEAIGRLPVEMVPYLEPGKIGLLASPEQIRAIPVEGAKVNAVDPNKVQHLSPAQVAVLSEPGRIGRLPPGLVGTVQPDLLLHVRDLQPLLAVTNQASLTEQQIGRVRDHVQGLADPLVTRIEPHLVKFLRPEQVLLLTDPIKLAQVTQAQAAIFGRLSKEALASHIGKLLHLSNNACLALPKDLVVHLQKSQLVAIFPTATGERMLLKLNRQQLNAVAAKVNVGGGVTMMSLISSLDNRTIAGLADHYLDYLSPAKIGGLGRNDRAIISRLSSANVQHLPAQKETLEHVAKAQRLGLTDDQVKVLYDEPPNRAVRLADFVLSLFALPFRLAFEFPLKAVGTAFLFVAALFTGFAVPAVRNAFFNLAWDAAGVPLRSFVSLAKPFSWLPSQRAYMWLGGA